VHAWSRQLGRRCSQTCQLSPKQAWRKARKWLPSWLAQPVCKLQYPPLSSLFGRLSAPMYQHPRLRNFEPAPAYMLSVHFGRLPLNSFPLCLLSLPISINQPHLPSPHLSHPRGLASLSSLSNSWLWQTKSGYLCLAAIVTAREAFTRASSRTKPQTKEKNWEAQREGRLCSIITLYYIPQDPRHLHLGRASLYGRSCGPVVSLVPLTWFFCHHPSDEPSPIPQPTASAVHWIEYSTTDLR
jgi:hypothetical protein